jgi:hypothetical protein
MSFCSFIYYEVLSSTIEAITTIDKANKYHQIGKMDFAKGSVV